MHRPLQRRAVRSRLVARHGPPPQPEALPRLKELEHLEPADLLEHVVLLLPLLQRHKLRLAVLRCKMNIAPPLSDCASLSATLAVLLATVLRHLSAEAPVS
jgi:hypothetical protein